jgi:hypothetical protein
MNFTVCGCGMSFKASGLRSHQRQSLDTRCQTEGPPGPFDDYGGGGDCDMSENMDIDPQNLITDIVKNTPGAEYTEFEVDPAGDLFGDYQDYIPEEFGMDGLDSNVSDDESEGTIDEEEFIHTNHSEILEPERVPPSESPDNLNPDEMESPTKTVTNAMRLRGGAEEVLQKQPFVIKFTKGKAGAIYANQRVDGDNLNTSYRHKVANAENLYNPFSSKLEWEIARWAKMRGPSSTAFNDLIEIDGVSIISCQAAHTP